MFEVGSNSDADRVAEGNTMRAYLTPALVAALLAAGCTTTKPEARRGVFTFTHEGARYEIVSTVTSTGDGYNLLLLRDAGSVVLRAKDYDQNGTLDTLLTGETPLADADAIYAAGIAAARLQGSFSAHGATRTHQLTLDGQLYTVQTIAAGTARPFNRLVFVDATTGREHVYVDVDADGVLDRVEKDDGAMEASQLVYEQVLDDGVRAGRIAQTDGRYVVRAPSVVAVR